MNTQKYLDELYKRWPNGLIPSWTNKLTNPDINNFLEKSLQEAFEEGKEFSVARAYKITEMYKRGFEEGKKAGYEMGIKDIKAEIRAWAEEEGGYFPENDEWTKYIDGADLIKYIDSL